MIVNLGSIAGVALIDSGNTWSTVISSDFFEYLGFSLQRDLKTLANSPTIGTATQNNNLDVLGETRQFMHLSFPPLQTKFKVKPAVVANLSMNINIAGTFLKRHNIDQLQSEDCLRIQTHKITLHSQVDDIFNFETTELCSYIRHKAQSYDSPFHLKFR